MSATVDCLLQNLYLGPMSREVGLELKAFEVDGQVLLFNLDRGCYEWIFYAVTDWCAGPVWHYSRGEIDERVIASESAFVRLLHEKLRRQAERFLPDQAAWITSMTFPC